MKRRNFINGLLAFGSIGTVVTAVRSNASGRIEVTDPSKLEVGMVYQLVDRKNGRSLGAKTCKFDGAVYFGERDDQTWADINNSQAFDQWRIFETGIKDESYCPKQDAFNRRER